MVHLSSDERRHALSHGDGVGEGCGVVAAGGAVWCGAALHADHQSLARRRRSQSGSVY